MRTAEFLREYCTSNVVDAVVVDDLGVGGGVVDRLRELGLGRARLAPFIGSAQAQDSERFYNRAAEAWWKMAEAYRGGELDTEDDRALIEQVSSRRRVQGRDERDTAAEQERDARVAGRGGRAGDDVCGTPEGGGLRYGCEWHSKKTGVSKLTQPLGRCRHGRMRTVGLFITSATVSASLGVMAGAWLEDYQVLTFGFLGALAFIGVAMSVTPWVWERRKKVERIRLRLAKQEEEIAKRRSEAPGRRRAEFFDKSFFRSVTATEDGVIKAPIVWPYPRKLRIMHLATWLVNHRMVPERAFCWFAQRMGYSKRSTLDK